MNDASRTDPARAATTANLTHLSVGSEEGAPRREVDGTRTMVGHDVMRCLAIVRIGAASGAAAGGVGTHLAAKVLWVARLRRGWRGGGGGAGDLRFGPAFLLVAQDAGRIQWRF